MDNLKNEIKEMLMKVLTEVLQKSFSLAKDDLASAKPEDIAENMFGVISHLLSSKDPSEFEDDDYAGIRELLEDVSPEKAYAAIEHLTQKILTDVEDTRSKAEFINVLVHALMSIESEETSNHLISAVKKVISNSEVGTSLAKYLDSDVEEELELAKKAETEEEEEEDEDEVFLVEKEEGREKPAKDLDSAFIRIKEIIEAYIPPRDIAEDEWDVNLVSKISDVLEDIVQQRVSGEISFEEFDKFLQKLKKLIQSGSGALDESEIVLGNGSMQGSINGKAYRIRDLIRRLTRETVTNDTKNNGGDESDIWSAFDEEDDDLVNNVELDEETSETETDEIEESKYEEEIEEIESEEELIDDERKKRIVAHALVDSLTQLIFASEGTKEQKNEVREQVRAFANSVGVDYNKVALPMFALLKSRFFETLFRKLGGE